MVKKKFKLKNWINLKKAKEGKKQMKQEILHW